MNDIRVPSQPVLDHIENGGGDLSDFFEKEDVIDRQGKFRCRVVPDQYQTFRRNQTRLARAAERGWIDYFMADELCIDVFNLHPALVFGPEWWDYPENKGLQALLHSRDLMDTEQQVA